MLDLPENELFSAYIDGELTAEEQAEVEQILSDNPDAQQLVDELRSLSQSLQALPAYKLDVDLAARVLRQAEQEMLAEPAAPLPKFHQVDEPAPAQESWARRLLRPRNFAWSAAAILVAVVFALNEPGQDTAPSKHVAEGTDGTAVPSLEIIPSDEHTAGSVESAIVAAPTDENPAPKTPDAVAPTPSPTMVAEQDPAQDQPQKHTQPAPTKGEDPLLVLQCQLADGRIGSDSLVQLLQQAGIAFDKTSAVDGSPIEITLTTDQVRQVVAHLQESPEKFKSYSFASTAKTAPPRIPAAIGPDGAHSPEATSSDEDGSGKSPETTFHVEGTFTIHPKVPSEAESAKATKPLPVEDNRIYRVRFVIKPAEKAPAPEKPAEQ